jgi:glycosyltransferase involved in cell wall biosynthesis
MVPWGGNVPHPPAGDIVDEMIQSRRDEPIHLTAIGVHWQRKGADVILDTFRVLRKRGTRCRLTIIGMTPPAGESEADQRGESLQVLPFLDKSDPAQVRSFEKILAKTHFLLAPSRVEAFGHIFSEAAAFGVPTIASDVGGIPTSIEDGVNGRLLPLEATGEDYARVVEQCHADQAAYGAMARASRARFERDLNWSAFCRTIVDKVERLNASASLGLVFVGVAALLMTGQGGPQVHA